MSASLRAVVVGINTYQDPRYRKESTLRYARADAEAVAAMMFQLRTFTVDDVQLLTDERAGAKAVRNQLDVLFSSRGTGASRIALFYFAGHGLHNPKDDRISLCCHDVDFADPNTGGIRLNDIYDLLRNSSADCAIAILDACFSGGIIDITRVGHESAAERAKLAIEAMRGRDGKTQAIFAACRTDQVSRERDGHGVYTAALLEGWRDGLACDTNGEVTLLGLANYISRRFIDDRQVPPYTLLGNRPIILWRGAPPSPATPGLPLATPQPMMPPSPSGGHLTFDPEDNRIPIDPSLRHAPPPPRRRWPWRR